MEDGKVHGEPEPENTKSAETDGGLFPDSERESKEHEEHRFVGRAFLSTSVSLYRVLEVPRTERVLECFEQGDEEHSTS